MIMKTGDIGTALIQLVTAKFCLNQPVNLTAPIRAAPAAHR